MCMLLALIEFEPEYWGDTPFKIMVRLVKHSGDIVILPLCGGSHPYCLRSGMMHDGRGADQWSV